MRRQSACDSWSKGRRVEDARVAHDRIDATEPVERRTNDRLAALGAIHGVVRRHRHTTRTLDLLDDPVGDAGVCAVAVHGSAEVVHDDGRAAPRQLESVEAPEASARSGDDGDLAGEVDHAASRD